MKKVIDNFSFECQMTACCCTNMEIFLNPYDILQLASAANMTTTELIDRHILFLHDRTNNNQRPILKQARTGICFFNQDKLCMIHKTRPLSCRLFPLARINNEYYIQEADFCQGLKVDRLSDLNDYLDSDTGRVYIEAADRYHLLISAIKDNLKVDDYYHKLINILLFDYDYFFNGEYANIENKDKLELIYHLVKELLKLINIEPALNNEEVLNRLFEEGDRFIAKVTC